MSDDGEDVMAQCGHHLDEVARHGPLRLLTMIGKNLRLARAPVAAHVRADNAETGGSQPGCDPVPGRAGAGMAVDQQDRRTGTAVSHPEPHIAAVDHLVGETIEHGYRLT